MGEHEAVPADIAKTLTGWKKHFNSYTQQGRFNVSLFNYIKPNGHILLKYVPLFADRSFVSRTHHCRHCLFHHEAKGRSS